MTKPLKKKRKIRPAMTTECTMETGTFNDFFQATLAKEILESNGISCIITGLNMSVIEVNPDTKIKLLVNKNDAEQAGQLIGSFFS